MKLDSTQLLCEIFTGAPTEELEHADINPGNEEGGVDWIRKKRSPSTTSDLSARVQATTQGNSSIGNFLSNPTLRVLRLSGERRKANGARVGAAMIHRQCRHEKPFFLLRVSTEYYMRR